MLKSLDLIKNVRTIKDIPVSEVWLRFLMYTKQKSYNLKNVEDLAEVSNKSVLGYVIRTLEALDMYMERNEECLTEEDMKVIAEAIYLTAKDFEGSKDKVRDMVTDICKKYPLYE